MKFIHTSFASIFLLMFANNAAANQCSEVLKLSAIEQGTIETEDSFNTQANNFCRDYSKGTLSANSSGVDVGYGGFSLGFSGSNSSNKSVAEKVCKNDKYDSSQNNVYKSYVKNIAPLAYSSYNACLGADRGFSVTLGSSTPTYVPITFSFKVTIAAATALVDVEHSPDIDCSLVTPYEMKTAGTVTFNCTRNDASKQGSITITNRNESDPSSKLSFPWTAFDGTVPVNLAQEYNRAIREAKEVKAGLIGSVIAYPNSNCPSGFEPYEPAQGRFIRGIDPTDKIDTDRASIKINERAGTLQDDMLEKHSHGLSNAGPAKYDSGSSGRRVNTGGSNLSTSSTGGYETRPKNVALLYCQYKG